MNLRQRRERDCDGSSTIIENDETGIVDKDCISKINIFLCLVKPASSDLNSFKQNWWVANIGRAYDWLQLSQPYLKPACILLALSINGLVKLLLAVAKWFSVYCPLFNRCLTLSLQSNCNYRLMYKLTRSSSFFSVAIFINLMFQLYKVFAL